MDALQSFLANNAFNKKISEGRDAIRFNEIPYNSHVHRTFKDLYFFLRSNNYGDLRIATDLGDADIEQDFQPAFEGSCVAIIQKKEPIYFLTPKGFQDFLQENPELPTDFPIRINYLKNQFSSYSTSFALLTPNLLPSVNVVSPVSVSKYLRILNEGAQKLIPANITQWVTSTAEQEKAPAEWRIESSKRLVGVIGTEISFESDKLTIEFKGDRRKVLIISFDDTSVFLTIFSVLHRIVEWIYLEFKDVDSRHLLYNQQICYLITDENATPKPEDLVRYLSIALETSQAAYRYFLLDAAKEVQKNLTDLNKNLFEYVTKMRQSASDLGTSLWRDFAIVLAVVILNFSTKQPEVFKTYFNWFGIALIVYMAISFFMTSSSGFWYYYSIRNSMADWRSKLYGYLADKEFSDLAVTPFAKSYTKFRIAFFISLLAYIVLIAAITFLIVKNRVTAA